MSDDEDIQLKICQTSLFAIVVPNKEPVTSFIIKRDFQELEGYDVPFRDHGFSNIDDFLRAHPMLNSMKDPDTGRWVYTAKISEKSANIQRLVAGQKKKKRKGKNGGPFSRTASYRYPNSNRGGANFNNRASYHGKTNTPIIFGKGDARKTNIFAPRPVSSFNQSTSQPKVMPAFLRPSSGSSSSSTNIFQKRPVPPRRELPKPSAFSISPMTGPVEGMRRLNAIMDKGRGAVTLARLVKLYANLYSERWNGDELKRWFGTNDLSEILRKHAVNKIVVEKTVDGSVMLTSREVLERLATVARKMEERMATLTVIKPERQHCKVPSLVPLMDALVEELIQAFPSPISLSDLPSLCENRFGVGIDPEKIYSKSWEELANSTFSGKIVLRNGQYHLHAKIVKANGLDKNVAGGKRKMELVTLESLDIQYDDMDEDESDDDGTMSTTGSEWDTVRESTAGFVSGKTSINGSEMDNEGPDSPNNGLPIEKSDDKVMDDLAYQLNVTNFSESSISSKDGLREVKMEIKEEVMEEEEMQEKEVEQKSNNAPSSKTQSFLSAVRRIPFFGFKSKVKKENVEGENDEIDVNEKVEPLEIAQGAIIVKPRTISIKALGGYTTISAVNRSYQRFAYKLEVESHCQFYELHGNAGFLEAFSSAFISVIRRDGPAGTTSFLLQLTQASLTDKDAYEVFSLGKKIEKVQLAVRAH